MDHNVQITTPDNKKDDQYWAKRSKNNFAAKRSREARRLKENQIALRASYLEKQNIQLKMSLKVFQMEPVKVVIIRLIRRYALNFSCF